MRPSCFGKGKSKVGIMAEKSPNESCHCFLGFCPVLSLPQRFVWRCRGFDWRVLSFLSLLFCLFGVFSVFGHGYIFFLRNDFSGRREVFRSIGTHACGHAHMNGYGGLSISASQKIGCALQLVAWAEWALGQTWSRWWGLSLRCISWCRDHGCFYFIFGF